MSNVYHNLAGGSLTQNWSNTSQITANDDWSGVPSIQGFLGQDITTATGTDPQTLTTDSTVANDLDVIANQSNPNTLTTGGVAEFDGIADQTAALQGSGTADVPHLILYLDATGRQNVRVQFNARDIDGSADNAAQQLNVQYRVGETGPWTNVAGGYFADVTTQNTATQVTAVDVTLPAAANNQTQVQVRIMTTNAVGNDEWVGIDDITVSSSPLVGPPPATVSINDVSITEGDAGTQTLTFTVTRSDNTGTFSVDYATQNGSATAPSDFVAESGTINFTAGGALTQEVTITINGDTDFEADETLSVLLSNVQNTSGTAELGDASGTGTILNDDVTRIYDIQGKSHISPFMSLTPAERIVTTRGVVTAIDTNGSRGFYIQDATGDGDDATSDGIFVFLPSGTLPTVGHLVEVTGTVTEFTPSGAAFGAFSTTEITTVTNIEDLGVGPEIDPVLIGGPGGRLPPTESLPAGGLFYESMEGMLVTVRNAVAVGPTNSFGEIFTVVDSDANPANGVHATGLTDQGNLMLTPGNPDFGDNNSSGGDFNPERIQVDDDNGVSGVVTPLVNLGTRLTDVTGVVNYDFGNYQVVATQPFTAVAGTGLDDGDREVGTLVGDADHLLVASYNAENLDFLDPQSRFDTIADEILNNLNLPDIIALQEIQDNDGPQASPTGVSSADQTLQRLLDAINAHADLPDGVVYAFIDNPFIGDQTNGGEPGGNIRAAYLYRTDRVDFVEGSLRTIAADGSAISNPDESAPDGNGDQQNNPDNPYFGSRPPLVATFTFNGEDVTIVNNHFTSRGGSAPLLGEDQPPFAAGEVQRAAQAQAVNTFVETLLQADENANVIVAGDLNEFPFEEPMNVMVGLATLSNYDVLGDDPFDAVGDYTAGGTRVLFDLMDTLPEDEQYDYVFEGNTQTLDHVLASSSLNASAEFDVVHINSEFAVQTSDHDPLLARFEIEAPTYTLQLLHASDFEAGLNAVDRAGNFAAILDYLEDTHANSITLAGGDNYLPSPFFNAGGDPSLEEVYETAFEDFYNLAPGTLNLAASVGRADIAMLNIMGVQASAFGNHEFDAGTREVQNIIARTNSITNATTPGWIGAQFPYLSANIDVTPPAPGDDPNLSPLFTNQIRDASTYNTNPLTVFPGAPAGVGEDRIAPSTIINENGRMIGVVGVTTQILESLSSTGGLEIIGEPDEENMQALADVLQPAIDAVIAQGANIVILAAHLQQITFDQEIAELLDGVDIIMAAGSSTLLADSEDVARGLRPGDTADGPYPIVIESGDGETTLIVNTDQEYSYVGRLVVDFDSQGHIILDSLDPNVSGAFATTDEAVADLYAQGGVDVDADGDIDAADADPFASGSRGDLVNDIAQAVGNIIEEQDGNVFGRTDVYLEGRRHEVRTEETNLGDLSSDAAIWYAQQTDPTVVAAIRNGGGIRDSIGRIATVNGVTQELPPGPNPAVGSEEGDVSQLDIANALRFNNALSLVTLTPEQLLIVLEHAVAATGPGQTPGQFGQIGGIQFSFDATQTAQVLTGNPGTGQATVTTEGNRILSAALVDENGELLQTIIENGEVVAGAPSSIRMVTLNFMIDDPDANGLGGDNYPFNTFITQDPAFANRVDLDPTPGDDVAGRTGVATFSDNGREQDALAEYLAEFHAETPYNQLDVGPAGDERIQNLAFRGDTVLANAAPVIAGDLAATVEEGDTVVITTADLTEADPDHSGDNLTYMVTGTLNGSVLLNGAMTTSFTQADIANGLVSFQHGGPNTDDASFTVTLEDAPGLTSAAATVEIDVTAAAPDTLDVAAVPNVLWQHDSGTVGTNTLVGSLPDTWEINGTGDFDGDGDSDIVWRNDDGSVRTWELEGGSLAEEHDLPAVPTNWQIVATGDLDGDGDDEILWRHNEGDLVSWELDAAGNLAQTNSLGSAPVNWTVAGTGDFDGDGDDDILWRHDDGQVVSWEMQDGEFVVNHNLPAANPNWSIEGTGDFDADGDDDILWRHEDGQVVGWEMEDGAYVVNHNLAAVPTNFHIEGVGNFNGDATDDIIWRHDDGTVVTWNMQNNGILATPDFGVTENVWQIRGTGEFPLA
jgi:predicted extracellular nuclease/2',3'-cyclic-nucleotide 2'-phosphodiesterase (5'-nucleotidase family)